MDLIQALTPEAEKSFMMWGFDRWGFAFVLELE